MQAYHNDPKVKTFFLDRMKAHIEADELVSGLGWEDGKGCSVGCLFHDYNHSLGPELMGTPEWVHKLQDVIHENCSEEYRKTFSVRFLEAIPEGKDIDPIKSEIQLFILGRNKERVESLDISRELKKQVLDSIDLCIILHSNEWDEGRESAAAWSAASAESAAWSAASAESAARSAAWSAESAAWSAAWSAESAAWSAESAARSAAWSAESAAESAARSAARSAESGKEIETIGDKLIELLAA